MDLLKQKVSIINEMKDQERRVDFNENEYWGANFLHGPIWNIFLLHIIAPLKFPMLDQHTARAYNFLTVGILHEIPKDAEKQRYYNENYRPFFEGLAAQCPERKKLDEALMMLGKFLRSPYGKILVKIYRMRALYGTDHEFRVVKKGD